MSAVVLYDYWRSSASYRVRIALNMLGIETGGVRLPIVEATEDERAAVRAVLERHGLLQTAGA